MFKIIKRLQLEVTVFLLLNKPIIEIRKGDFIVSKILI